ncbi:MAG TPA: hypothetical protein VN081_06255 [Dongiaceae bacterium]|nr:hypothetical protein [Dongiaceae bacterium]
MDQSESTQARGVYDQLSPALIEEAYLENYAYDLRRRSEYTDTLVAEFAARRHDEANSAIKALEAVEGLSHDEFLRSYQLILSNLDRLDPSVRDFEKMMDIRRQLVPGEFLYQNDSIATLLAPESSDDGNYGIRPKLLPHGKSSYRLHWEVTISESDKPATLGQDVLLGREAILNRLRDRLYVNNRNVPKGRRSSYLRKQAALYDKLGEPYAFQLNKEAVEAAETHLNDILLNPLSRYEPTDVSSNFSVLEVLDEGAYEKVLSAVKKTAAKGYFKESTLELVGGYLDYMAQKTAHTKGEATYNIPTPAEVAQLYADFAKEGETLIEQEAAQVEASDSL